jgi:NADH-quinone oxidoreductase subunit L
MTAFYMFRLLFLTFFGEFRGTDEQRHHLHESPATMTIPLIILAALSIVGGWIGLPHGVAHALGLHNSFDSFMEPVLGSFKMEASLGVELGAMAFTTVLIVAFIYYAYIMYVKKQMRPVRNVEELTGTSRLLAGKFFIDEFYRKYIVRSLDKLSALLEQTVERILDGTVNGSGSLVASVSGRLRLIQNGQLDTYAMVFVLAVAAMLLAILI